MVKKKLTEGICVELYQALAGIGEMSAETAIRLRRYQLMKEMGWTYREYQQTPAWLVTEVEAFMRTELKVQESNSASGQRQ